MEHTMEEAFFENSRVDALSMERLTSSPYVMNIYSFCGMSVMTEYASHTLAQVVSKKSSTSMDKLSIAMAVAHGIADVHSIDGYSHQHHHHHHHHHHHDMFPSLVHNDINLANVMVSNQGIPKLNDFNIAILLMKHRFTHEPCMFHSHFPNPQWRAPEEQVNDEYESEMFPPNVTEKVDIYALGNILYRIVVGTTPWKDMAHDHQRLTENEKHQLALLKRWNGSIPVIPPSVLHSNDTAIQAMVEAMMLCFQYNPMDRPSAQNITSFLQDKYESLAQNSR
jgi:serine/threonine protein kinase